MTLIAGLLWQFAIFTAQRTAEPISDDAGNTDVPNQYQNVLKIFKLLEDRTLDGSIPSSRYSHLSSENPTLLARGAESSFTGQLVTAGTYVSY